MTQRLSFDCMDSAGDCQICVPGLDFHNTVHMRNLVMHLQCELERHRHYAANQVCDGVTDFLRMLRSEFMRIQERYSNRMEEEEEVASAIHQVDAVIDQLQVIRREFRPAVLDEFGLVRAVESEVLRLCENAAIKSRICIKDQNLAFNDNFETTLFRVVEEALANIEKHASASEVVFAYGISDDSDLIIELRDNGKGIPNEKLYDPLSVGLISMREQMAIVGGKIDVVPMAEAGTLVFISIPKAVWTAQIRYIDKTN